MDYFEDFLRLIFDPKNLAGALFYAIVFLTAALLAGRLARLFARRSARHLSDTTALNFVVQFLQVVIFLVALILYAHLIPALRAMGTALLTGVSVASVVVGLAAQNTLGNLVAGFSLLLYRPFHIGDRVQLNTPRGVATGTVAALSLGYTVLTDPDNHEIIVPNSVMVTQVIIRLAHEDRVPLGGSMGEKQF
ncbi:MAG TPA: mechanosensitive ion channel domain-containing protein [Candidatus Binatia bacterium]|nr:mechanosensitive ion channel domain-containing protein [Candidatus Binatia bacterium]